MSETLNRILQSLDNIERRYDHTHDLIAGGPEVTWVDMELVRLMKLMAKQIDELQLQVSQNNGGVND